MSMQAPKGRFEGYLQREVPAEDSLLTHTGPGTPMGEAMRRHWQPVCAMYRSASNRWRALRTFGPRRWSDPASSSGSTSPHCASFKSVGNWAGLTPSVWN